MKSPSILDKVSLRRWLRRLIKRETIAAVKAALRNL